MVPRVYRLHERLVNLRSEYNLRLKSGVTTQQIPMTQIHATQVMQQAPVLQQAPMRLRPELDEVTMRYIQDLLGWVEENQRRVDKGEWGSDLPSVESQLGSHRGLHQSVEEFRSKIERARADEVTTFLRDFYVYLFFKTFFFNRFNSFPHLQSQISPASKAAYRDYLGKLELQYNKLLVSRKKKTQKKSRMS